MAERIAILTANHHPVTCGIGDHSVRLAQALTDAGHVTRVIARRPVAPSPLAPDVDVVGVERGWPVVVARRMARAVDDFAPDRVVLQYVPHLFDNRRAGSFAPLLLAQHLRRRGIELVLLAHELFTPWGRRPDHLARAAAYRAQLAAMVALSTRVVATTGSRVRSIERLARPLGKRVDLVPVPPNVDPVPARPAPDAFRIGTFTTLAVGKRIDVVLDAFATVAAQVPEAELVLLGDPGAPGARPRTALERAIAGHPHATQIRLPGKLPLSVIAEEISRLRVYLHPMDTGANTRSGTLPVALGAGVPVVATLGAETDPIFVGDSNVAFADALSGEAFAAQILRLRQDGELARRLSAGGRELYAARLSWPRVAELLVAP